MSWVNHFDLVRIVSMPNRRDRRRDMRTELLRIGAITTSDDLYDPSSRVAFFDAYRISHPGLFRSAGSHGCFLSHLTILEDAARDGKTVLILQDDCDFTAAALSMTAPPQCDIFYGGYLLIGCQSRPHDCHIVGAHCMGFSALAAARAATYLRTLLDPKTAPDPLAASSETTFKPGQRPPIDGSLVWFRRAHPELVTIFEKVSEQRSSRTDIGIRHPFDRVPVLRHALNGARRVRRMGLRMMAAGIPGYIGMKSAHAVESLAHLPVGLA